MAGTDGTERERAASVASGQVCYLQIPARDPMASAEFYEKVFGWCIERPYPSFESPGLIGQWVSDRPTALDAGPLLWINVESIADTLKMAGACGARIINEPSQDGPRQLAIISDPAGNAVGIVQH